MDLILWRHAEAFELRELEEGDLDRALTHKGERQAQRVAQWLNHSLPATTRVLASPARRCQQTAAALGREFGTIDALAPDSGVVALLAAARWPDARDPVLVVGHQPTLGLAAAWLLAGVEQSWGVKKCGVWWLRGRLREGELRVLLHAVLGPELL